jgi:protein-histidine pros-kinase
MKEQDDERMSKEGLLLPGYLSALSHDIRTPLNAIIGFSGLMLEPGLSKTEQENYLLIINRNSRRLLNIVTCLIDLAKMESGDLEVSFTHVPVIRMVADIRKETEEMVRIYGKKNLDIKVIAPVRNNEGFTTDWPRLFQVVRIIIDNSLKFTESGSVGVNIDLSAGDTMRISICDSGTGMDEQTLKTVFDLFPGPDESAKGKSMKLRGLNMMLAKRICDLLQAGIQVESVPGDGTTVIITLPKNPVSPALDPAKK